jgi:hypothetical protein
MWSLLYRPHLIRHRSYRQTVLYKNVIWPWLMTAVAVHRQHLALIIVHPLIIVIAHQVFSVQFWSHATIPHILVHLTLLCASSTHVVQQGQCVCHCPGQLSVQQVMLRFSWLWWVSLYDHLIKLWEILCTKDKLTSQL